MFDGSEYLVIINYYSKVPIVLKMPTSQCNSVKMIIVLKELLAKHDIQEEIQSDNGPQFESHLSAEFTKTPSSRNLRSNGQAESAVKIVKDLLTHAKCSRQDPYLTLLAYRSTPVDSHLWSPVKMLYQNALCTPVPQRIRHKDPHATAECETLEEYATQSIANHDCTGCCKKAPLFAINNDRTLWFPATVVCVANHGSYIISHWWIWVQMSMRPHSWTWPRCCQSWHAHQGWNSWTTCHHSTNFSWSASTCCSCGTTICCSHNTQASCILQHYSSNLYQAYDTCTCRCTTTDQQNWCHTLLIWLCQ